MNLKEVIRHPIVVWISFAFGLAAAFHLYVLRTYSYPLVDFRVYLDAGSALLSPGNIYQGNFRVTTRFGGIIEMPYLYPPLLAHLLSKAHRIPPGTVQLWWCIFNFLAILGASVLLAESLRRSWWTHLSRSHRILIVTFFVFCFEPLFGGNSDGQVTALILALIAACMWCAQNRQDTLAGALLGVAIQIKTTPALLLLAPVMFGRWRLVLSTAVTTLALIAYTWIDLGSSQVFLDFLSAMRLNLGDTFVRDDPFNFVPQRVLLAPFHLRDSPTALWILRGLLVAYTALGVMLIRRQSGDAFLRALAFLVVMMILISPIVWFHHFAWALPPLAVLSMRPPRDNDDLLKSLTITVAIYFALNQTFTLHYWIGHLWPSFTPLSAALPTILLVALSVLILRQRAP